MEFVQPFSIRNREETFPARTKILTKKPGLISLFFRYALPFILFHVVALGIVALVYFGHKIQFSSLGTGFFLYCTSFIMLAALQRGLGSRRSGWFLFLYSALVLFLLGGLGSAVLATIGNAHVLGFFNTLYWKLYAFAYRLLDWAIYAFVATNFFLLPGINIAVVFWKAFAKRIERLLPWLFPGIGSMYRSESIVRLGCSLLILSTFGYATQIEPNTLRVERVDIMSDKVSENVTILHLSDMHIHAIGRNEERLFRKIQQLDPDIILQTGDLMDLYNPEDRDEEVMKELADRFRQLSPRYGTYWIVGNHDYGLEKIDWFYERAGATLLHDDEWLISGDAGRFRLLGLSCEKSWWERDADFIKAWANAAAEDEFTIVMGHVPDYIPEIVEQDIDLCLAGHLHGGQIYIPIVSQILAGIILREIGSDFPAKWVRGYHEVHNTRINLSVGTWGSPRFNCPPTITLLTVQHQLSTTGG